MKKILSLVLVLALVLGTFSFAFAATPLSDVQGKDCEDAVARLVGLGIIDGYEDGTYRPEKVVTRAELAKVVIIALGLENVADFAESMGIFSDMDGHWAKKYVNVAASKGIIKGYPDGTFRPDATVSYAEAITLLVRALGYNDEVLGGTWPINYLTKADELGITDDVNVVNGGANRGDVAILLDATLQQKMVTIKDGEVVEGDNTLISKIAELKEYDVLDVKDGSIVINEDGDEVDTLVDMSDYLFQTVNAYVNEDGVIVYVDEVLTETYEGTVSSVDKANNEVTIEDSNGDEETYEIGDEVLVRFNDVDVQYKDVEDKLADATIKVVYTTDDEDNVTVQRVIATEAVDYVVVDNDYDAETVEDNDFVYEVNGSFDIELPTTTNDDNETILDTDNIVVTGDVDELEDIKADDVIYVYVGYDSEGKVAKVKIEVVRDTVEGKVEKAKAESGKLTYVTIDGKEYEAVTDAVAISDVNVGAVNTLILDADGKVVKVIPAEDATVEGYIVEVEPYTILEEGKTVNVNDVTILTADGEETYRVADGVNTPVEGQFGKATLNEDGEIAAFAVYAEKDIKVDNYTVQENDVDTDENTLTVAEGTYLVDEDTVIFDFVGEDFATLADIKEGMVIDYELDGLNVTKIFIQQGVALDAVTGIYVGQYSEVTSDGTDYYVTLNVEGEEIDYKVEAEITNAPAAGTLVALKDTSNFGTYDTIDPTNIIDTSVARSALTIDGSKILTGTGDDYLVTSSTVIYVIDADGNATIGDIEDIEDADDAATISFVKAGSTIGGYEKADIIVVK